MIPEAQDLRVENALLRGCLFLNKSALKDYHDSKYVQGEGGWLELSVPESLRSRAAEALERANRMLNDQQQGRGR